MADFPAGPGADLSGVFIPDSHCEALGRELGRMARLAHGAPGKSGIHPLVRAHLAQLHFASGRFSAAAAGTMQVSQGSGNAEFRCPGDLPLSGQKPAGLGTTEVARVLEMTPRSVLNLIYRGSLKGARSARGWIVDMGSVAELCERRRKKNDESKAA